MCSAITQLKTKQGASLWKGMLENPSSDQSSEFQPGDRVSDAIIEVFKEMYPEKEIGDRDILATISSWSFKRMPLQLATEHEHCELSLVEDSLRKSFVETKTAAYETINRGKYV